MSTHPDGYNDDEEEGFDDYDPEEWEDYEIHPGVNYEDTLFEDPNEDSENLNFV